MFACLSFLFVGGWFSLVIFPGLITSSLIKCFRFFVTRCKFFGQMETYARFRRRTAHELNRNEGEQWIFSFAFDSARVKYGV